MMATLLLGPLAPALASLGQDAAFARNDGNAGGNGGGNGNGNSNAGGNGKANGKGKAKPEAVQSIKVAVDANYGLLASELKALESIIDNPAVLKRANSDSQIGRYRSYLRAAEATIAAARTYAKSGSEADLHRLQSAQQAEIDALAAAANGRSLSSDAITMIREVLGVSA